MQENELIKRISSIKTDLELSEILNENPPENWIKTHDEIQTYRFLPIEKVQFLLRTIFGFNLKKEVVSITDVKGFPAVAFRIHYKTFESDDWLFVDGVGAPETIDPNDKYSMSAAVPIAKSNAEKNAAMGLGKLFGNDLNRIDSISNNPKTSNEKKLSELKKLYEEKKSKIDFDNQLFIERIIEDKETIDYQKIIDELKSIK